MEAMFHQKEFPRLTKFLRTYGDVAAPGSGDIFYDPKTLAQKKKDYNEKQANSDRLDGPDRYTRDFKYPHNQKSAGVKSGDRGAMGTCNIC
ncbi:hypothetical protein TNCV_2071531 [Trichonephila clavipes]|uniref:Uncharacterized protein n=1 Tax=Trichonephila clavipes TaxID=2585209 RepID=A0A8X6W3N5_TRICX|nr:hypothetical protein TNCV_2071531 [Trichonephila clavipes]